MHMIKNIVFDMGNVLMRFDPMALASHFASSQEDQKLLCEHVFSGPEWYALDAGSIDEEDALSSILSMMPDRLHAAAEEAFLELPRLADDAASEEEAEPALEPFALDEPDFEVDYRLWLIEYADGSTRTFDSHARTLA